MYPMYEEDKNTRHPQCPLQPIQDNNVNEALDKRLDELLMFALHGNCNDLSDYMRSEQEKTRTLIKTELNRISVLEKEIKTLTKTLNSTIKIGIDYANKLDKIREVVERTELGCPNCGDPNHAKVISNSGNRQCNNCDTLYQSNYEIIKIKSILKEDNNE